MRSRLTDLMRLLRNKVLIRWRVAKAWIRDGKPLWFWLAVAGVAFGLPYSFPANFFEAPVELADRVRWSGMLFQFLGLATVVWGLNTSRQLFGRASLWRSVIQWAARLRFIVKPPKPVSATGHVQAGAVAVAGSAVGVNVTPTLSIGDRVTRLENSVQKLEVILSSTKQDLASLRSQMGQRIAKERSERQAADRTVSEQLEAATIGGIHLELAGLAYLYVGILFTSVPEEAASLLRNMGL